MGINLCNLGLSNSFLSMTSNLKLGFKGHTRKRKSHQWNGRKYLQITFDKRLIAQIHMEQLQFSNKTTT